MKRGDAYDKAEYANTPPMDTTGDSLAGVLDRTVEYLKRRRSVGQMRGPS